MSVRALSRWLLLIILNGYILYSIVGLIAYVVFTMSGEKQSLWQSIQFGEFTFHRETTNNASSYYVGVSEWTPKIFKDSVVMVKDRQGNLLATKKDLPGAGFLMPVSKSQYKSLVYTYLLYALLLISMFFYLMILLVRFTRTSMTHMFRDAQNGKRLRRIGTLLLVFECIQLLFPVAVRFLPGMLTGNTGFGVSLNLPAPTGLPYGIVAGLLLIIISDAFDRNDE
jgi:hypothetical protein